MTTRSPKDQITQPRTQGSNGARANGDRPDDSAAGRNGSGREFALDPFEEERRARNGARRRYITY